MEFSQRTLLLQRLQSQSDAITEAWYHALLPTGFSTRSLPQLRQELGGLTESLITALLTEPFAPNLGDLIGVALANLGLQSPESLRATLTVLPEALVANLSEEDRSLLFPRITALHAAIGTGLFVAVRQRINTAHEQNHAALAAAHAAVQIRCQRMEEHLRAITLHVPLVLFTINRKGIITFIIGRGLASLDVTPDQLVGRAIAEVASEQPTIVMAVEAALQGEVVNVLIHAQTRLFETRYTPLFDDTGGVTGVIGVSLDITERPQPFPTDEGLHLTSDEQALLGLLAAGQTNRQIGQELGLGLKAVEKRLAKLFTKLGVTSRTEAVALAFRERLL
ncbi:MAG: helix-turn-helix transcriptional regulator [Blastochloris sp.]|nr:helix-turn-helix transcriptional regulator [Blastochloris sp.]